MLATCTRNIDIPSVYSNRSLHVPTTNATALMAFYNYVRVPGEETFYSPVPDNMAGQNIGETNEHLYSVAAR